VGGPDDDHDLGVGGRRGASGGSRRRGQPGEDESGDGEGGDAVAQTVLRRGPATGSPGGGGQAFGYPSEASASAPRTSIAGWSPAVVGPSSGQGADRCGRGKPGAVACGTGATRHRPGAAPAPRHAQPSNRGSLVGRWQARKRGVGAASISRGGARRAPSAKGWTDRDPTGSGHRRGCREPPARARRRADRPRRSRAHRCRRTRW